MVKKAFNYTYLNKLNCSFFDFDNDNDKEISVINNFRLRFASYTTEPNRIEFMLRHLLIFIGLFVSIR